MEELNYWKKCTTCKKEIPYKGRYWVCNVSTCNRKRTGLTFCGLDCWDAHLPILNHREAWAIEHHAPTRDEWVKQLAAENEPKKRTPAAESKTDAPGSLSADPAAPARVILRRTK